MERIGAKLEGQVTTRSAVPAKLEGEGLLKEGEASNYSKRGTCEALMSAFRARQTASNYSKRGTCEADVLMHTGDWVGK